MSRTTQQHKIRISHPSQIDLHWAQRIIRNHHQDPQLQAITVENVDVGTTTRIHVAVTHEHQHLPQRWFVKIPSLSLRSRMITALPRFLHKEVCFYRSLAHQLPIQVPKILATTSQFARGSTLVMGDLSDQNAKPGSAGEALSPEQAKQVVIALARLHAQHWGNSQVSEHHPWLNDWSHQMETHMGTLMARPLMQRGLQRANQWIEESLHNPALHYASHRRQAKQFLRGSQQTLVHYDCHPGNLFWQDSQPGFLDWQLVRMGEGIGDVAYFLATALEADDRRQYEQSLIDVYTEQLRESGITDLKTAEVFNRYQAHLVYPFEAMVITLSIGGMMDEPSNVEMIKRSSAAVSDHDSFARIRYA